jgi:hypothetical protein
MPRGAGSAFLGDHPARLRRFALLRQVEDPGSIIGYGFVLPDGSAVSVSWPPCRGSSFCSSASAEVNAALLGADIVWVDEKA